MTKLHDLIIVGSGPAGVGAALGAIGHHIKPLVLDVGNEPRHHDPVNENFYDYRKCNSVHDLMMGERHEGIYNILNRTSMSPKLTSPMMQYVIEGAEELSPLKEDGFKAVQSFAKGGLASAWGAGLFRYNERELECMPVSAAELEPYYDTLTREIGIIGKADDLTPYFGTDRDLMEPLKFSRKSGKLYRRYLKKRNKLNKKGIYMGFPRLGVLSSDHNGRSAEGRYNNTDSWLPKLPHVYNPAFTMERLVKEGAVDYRRRVLVKSWKRDSDGIVVLAKDLESGNDVSFRTKKLVLGAGAINSTKIVLASREDYATKLRLVDNPLVQVPLIFPEFIGSKLETEAFGMGHVSAVFDLRERGLLLQGGILELTSPARSAFFEQFPFSARNNMRLIRMAANAVLVMFLFFPSSKENSASIGLNKEGLLEITCPPYSLDKKAISMVANGFLKLGVMASSLFTTYSKPGYGIHYAGSLPMKEEPNGDYETDRFGQLAGEPGVHIVDGAVLPDIAAKNLSLTIMANAMRIADHIGKSR